MFYEATDTEGTVRLINLGVVTYVTLLSRPDATMQDHSINFIGNGSPLLLTLEDTQAELFRSAITAFRATLPGTDADQH